MAILHAERTLRERACARLARKAAEALERTAGEERE
jgi:hypothetical protein